MLDFEHTPIPVQQDQLRAVVPDATTVANLGSLGVEVAGAIPSSDEYTQESVIGYDNADPNSLARRFGRGVMHTVLAVPGAKTVKRVGTAFNDTVDALCVDAYVQFTNAETKKEKGLVATNLVTTGVSQAADRLRLPEAAIIPLAIKVAEQHGKLAGALTLTTGVYGVQDVVGYAWGVGVRRFKHAAQSFDRHFPGYKNYAAEGNAGYLTTLYRQSVLGIGVGNSPFMTGEVLHNPAISHQELAEKANRSSRRIALTAGVIGYGALSAAEEWYDKSVGIPGVFDVTVPELVEDMKKASFWIASGFAIDIGSRAAGKLFQKVSGVFRRDKSDKAVLEQAAL